MGLRRQTSCGRNEHAVIIYLFCHLLRVFQMTAVDLLQDLWARIVIDLLVAGLLLRPCQSVSS